MSALLRPFRSVLRSVGKSPSWNPQVANLPSPQSGNLLDDPHFDTGWSTFQATLEDHAVMGPNGALDAARITVDSSGSNIHGAQHSITNASQLSYRATCYFKRGSSGALNAGLIALDNSAFDHGSTVGVNLSTGAVIPNDPGTFGNYTKLAASAQANGGGWFRLTFDFRTSADGDFTLYVCGYDATDFDFAGDGAANIYAWGADLRLI